MNPRSSSDGQLGIPPPQPRPIDCHANIRADDGQTPRESRNRAQEVPEQHGDAVRLDDEADKRPLEQDQGQAGEEGGRAFCFLFAREEEEGFGRADYDGQADEEEELPVALDFDSFGLRFGNQGKRTLPMASLILWSARSFRTQKGKVSYMARSKKSITPPTRKKPPFPG